ncbi:MAG: hypothetical protein MJ244_06195 [Clostridia bacterium]|nr:hypothetical protein [Clostridia bacterium]
MIKVDERTEKIEKLRTKKAWVAVVCLLVIVILVIGLFILVASLELTFGVKAAILLVAYIALYYINNVVQVKLDDKFDALEDSIR